MKTKKGFTLIELLIVVAIVGILASVIVLNLTKAAKEKARIARLQSFADSVRGQLSGSPVAWWKFEGNANDIWGGNNGVFRNGATTVDGGVDGKAGRFIRSNCQDIRVVDVSNSSLDLMNAVTIEAWINFNSNSIGVGNNYTIAGKSGNYIMTMLNDGRIYTNYHNGSSWFGAAYSNYNFTNNDAEQWNHIVVSYSQFESRVKIFINGNSDQEVVVPNDSLNVNNADFRIGSVWGCGWAFDGFIDEVRIYGEALTAKQIQRLYAESAPKFRMTLK